MLRGAVAPPGAVMNIFHVLATAAILAIAAASPAAAARDVPKPCPPGATCRQVQISGVVSSGPASDARPVARANVAMYRAGQGAPQLLARTVADARGEFSLRVPGQSPEETRYVVANSGAVSFMTVVSAGDQPRLRINEMTTVASAYAMAQFLTDGVISGKALPLTVAAGMFRNLAAPDSGTVSQVLQTSPNADETNARREMATLANILAGCAREPQRCAPLFDLTDNGRRPTSTLDAIISIARHPTVNLRPLFALGEAVQPFQPALLAKHGPDAPDPMLQLDAFTIAVKVNRTGRTDASGQELCPIGGPGNFVFDPKGYAWITNNVVQGETGSTNCFFVLKPDGTPADGRNGTPVSPLFGGGVLGQGFGITRDPSGNIWAGNFGWGGVNPNGSVSKFSPKGKPLSPPAGYVSTLDRVQGTASDQAGNIWMASYYGSSVHVFPKGNPFTTYPAFADENTNPFHIMIDDKGAGWVSYTGTSALSKFTYTDRKLVKQFTVPIGSDANAKGLGIDSKGNAWATAGGESLIYVYDTNGNAIGSFGGGGITGPWGLSIDSHDNVWVANFAPADQIDLKYRLSELCGARPEHCPAGLDTGDPITPDTGYTLPSGGDQVLLASGQPLYGPLGDPSYKPLMRSTATQVDMAGNVWVTNNWKPSGLNDLLLNPGGDGMVIFVGLAAPVKPGIGQPKAP